MQKITEIWTDDACCDERGRGIVLYVHFQNGEGIIVSLDCKNQAEFYIVIPRTIYWSLR